ncbi:hypothetical protein AB0C84_44420 [Actinomadura sp. NPDC048955]|uniref:hypothetical protein n=1 Tax=Actinomadura sp. NPDC048955 TaxID=3158228 RepID=UPI0033D428C3
MATTRPAVRRPAEVRFDWCSGAAQVSLPLPAGPVPEPGPPSVIPDLRRYRWAVHFSSAGKDSQSSLAVLVQQADAVGVLDRVVVAHADLGDGAEWPGTPELARELLCTKFRVMA